MTNKIPVTDSSVPENVSVRRRSQGRKTVFLGVTVPTELNDRIIELAQETGKNRSIVTSELIEAGLESITSKSKEA